MEYIKRKRLLENYILRGDSPNYGLILNEKTDDLGNPIKDSLGNNIENTIDIDLFITHNYEDMGIMSDEDYIPFDPNYIGLSDTNQKYLGKRFLVFAIRYWITFFLKLYCCMLYSELFL